MLRRDVTELFIIDVTAIVHPSVFGLQSLSWLISTSSYVYWGVFNAKTEFPLHVFSL